MRLSLKPTHLAKRAFATAFYHSGLLWILRRRIMRGRAVILLYHRVVNAHASLIDYAPSGMTVARDDFDRQMSYVKRHYAVVHLSELIDNIEARRPLRDAMCAITFDDGWRDNYNHALPILRHHAIPATVFLTANFITGGKWFWEERLKYLLAHFYQRRREPGVDETTRAALDAALDELGLGDVLCLHASRLPAYLTVTVNQARTADRWRERLMSCLEELLSRPGLGEPRRFLNWEEIEQMAGSDIQFGAHTLTHLNFERCSLQEADEELREGKLALERQLRRPASLFAYPYGKNTDEVRALVPAAGYRCACTIRPGLVDAADDLFRLNRIDIHSSVAPVLSFFACRMLRLMNVF